MGKIIYKNQSESELKNCHIFLGNDVKIANGVVLYPNIYISGKSVIEEGCVIETNSIIVNSAVGQNVTIKSSYVEDSVVGRNTSVGPFSTIKKQSIVGENCRVGNFVEIKNSLLGNNVKVAHLTYVGDASVGDGSNVGCGVVFCNYNGEKKQKSIVGENVFIGSNVNIIAPVKIGDYAYIAAGSTINKDVESNQFAIARSYQTNKNNFKNPYKNH